MTRFGFAPSESWLGDKRTFGGIRARIDMSNKTLTAQRDGPHALGVSDDRIYVDHGLAGTGIDRVCGWPWPRATGQPPG
jgi:hypothetical protein